jgi:Mitochondrial carrier protein
MVADPDALERIHTPSTAVRAVRDISFGSVSHIYYKPQYISKLTFSKVAGMVSKVFEHPFDLCKVRLQSQVLDHTARFSGPIDCLTQTWKSEGLRGLYRVRPFVVLIQGSP